MTTQMIMRDTLDQAHLSDPPTIGADAAHQTKGRLDERQRFARATTTGTDLFAP